MIHTLLLADDSVTIQRLVELTFAEQDITVVCVGNGDHALASIRHSPPDIVLADVGMPGLSGYDVARHIKHTPELAHIPVLLLTGAFEPIDRARAIESGYDGMLTKPFEPQVVIERVKALLGVTSSGSHTDQSDQREAIAAAESRTGATARLDDYFDQLDQAIAAREVESPDRSVFFSPFESTPEQEAVADATAPVLTAVVPPPTPPARAAVRVREEPVLAGAFSALLAAEQAGAAPDAFTDWLPEEPEPAPVSPVVQTAAPVASDDLIDAAVERVLARLSETVVRGAVQDAVQDAVRDAVRDAVLAIASETAERLVREEIERIKSNIK